MYRRFLDLLDWVSMLDLGEVDFSRLAELELYVQRARNVDLARLWATELLCDNPFTADVPNKNLG